MLFNSYEFIFVFLPAILVTYFLLARVQYTRLATASLVAASLAFYSVWDYHYLPLLLCSIMFNYCIGSYIEKTGSKALLTVGVTINLLALAYFKYTAFFLTTINDTWGTALFVPHIILPLGISFFTFTQTAYLVDAYRGETKHYSFLTYSLFVSIFPHLIAGPILYHKDMIPQFSNLKNFVFSHKNMAIGVFLFCIGLAKKVLVADSMAPIAKLTFANADRITFIDAWLGVLGYTFQIYYDFSGYSEMALGLGLMFNFNLPVNFNSPYRALSVIDFWRRWHMSLSSFLRNYLYIALGGNRNGEFLRYRNLMLTMLLGGLWHGAGWTYIIWGGLHGLYLVINHFWNKLQKPLPDFIAWGLTFMSVIISWIFFRANSVNEAVQILQAMAGFKGVVAPMFLIKHFAFLESLGIHFGSLHVLSSANITAVIMLPLLLLAIKFMPNSIALSTEFKPGWAWTVALSALLTLCLVNLNRTSDFLYFQF